MVDLSVIIPTRNRPELLKDALTSLVYQTVCHDAFEVIVVDNGSSAESAETVDSFYGVIKNFRYVVEPSPGLHNARHRGLREAKADLLVYADDDIEAFPGWLEGIWRGFSQLRADLVGGKNLPKWEGEPPVWLDRLWNGQKEGARSLGFLSILDFGEQEKEIDPAYVWGCNYAVRRGVLLEAGGFHPDSMPEDLLHFRGDGESYVSRFIAARGYRAVYVPSASVHHIVPKGRMTVDYFRKRAFSQGISDAYTLLRRNPSGADGNKVKAHPLACLMGSARMRQVVGHFLPSGAFVRANINQAYRQGFEWHLHRFRTDEEVRNWVLRESYLDT